MTAQSLPHTPYIDAVEAVLTESQMQPESAQTWQDELDEHPVLRGTILLTPETSNIPADRWPHGLLIVWEWHTGQDHDIARGPSWHWASASERGWAQNGWNDLPVPGWAAPAVVAAQAAALAHTGTPIPMDSEDRLDRVLAAEAAIREWENTAEAGA